MASGPDTLDIDPKVKKAVEELKETIYKVLTAKGREELSNINKEEIKYQYGEYIKKDTEGKKRMIATEKEKLLKWGVKLGIFKQDELNKFLNSLEPRPDQHGGYPGQHEPAPSITEVLTSLVVVAAFGALLVSRPGAFDVLLDVLFFEAGYNTVLGGSKHKKRKGRKSKKTKKSMKHKKGRKSKKAKKSMKKKKGRKSMKKKKSNKKRK